jgi:hypothetical protein
MKQIYGGISYLKSASSRLNNVGSKIKSVGSKIKSVGKGIVSAPGKAASAITNTVNNAAQQIDASNEADMTISEKLKHRNITTNVLSPFIGFARNANDNTKSIFNRIKSKYKPETKSDKNTTPLPNELMSDEEKIKIKNKLKELNEQQQITDTEYEHAVQQLDKKDGILGIGDSVVSVMSPIQSIVKVIGDFFIKPAEADDIHGRQTIVKLLKFPASSKTFVKHNLGVLGKDPELDEYMVLVKESFNSPLDKISSDLLGVDNLLANVINGCVGAGCKDGESRRTPRFEKTVEFMDNVNKKKLLNEIKKNKLKEEKDNKSRLNQS